MGIPSYFSYILRKHPYIVTKITTADNLYIDSNSIIYDMASTITSGSFETTLIRLVCEKIDYYLSLIQPKRVIIAFDGVPPMAKIKQQRERRYKSWIMQKTNGPSTWNTVQITPGTAFMKELDIALHAYFKNYEKKYEYFKLSTSMEEGEGEHKIFSFIRENPELHSDQTTLVYGLDSDLIVLSLNHLAYGSIKLLREAPAFMLDDRELHLLDVPKLADGIKEIIGETKLTDYIFMTLLLGNDFMPHFPALNIRTTGFDTLLQTYTSCVLPHEKLFDGDVKWDVFRKFIQALSEKEETNIIKEYNSRNRWRVDTSSEEKKINNTPLLKREKEHFICPIKK
jgi:5'-3' exoribonuclease 1